VAEPVPPKEIPVVAKPKAVNARPDPPLERHALVKKSRDLKLNHRGEVAAASTDDPLIKISALLEACQQGLITREEFERQRAELLEEAT
jgi:hypothetical protein